ncbi:MAG: type II secretion system F family protein [Candidatus Spechtbacterales bacterium]|nr:type II secretion system F family protein [Candidatus Spechtbacterales bacterium]
MPFFEYYAHTKEGEVQSGRVEAVDENAAVQILQRNGLIVTELESVEGKSLAKKEITLFERVTKKELAVFARQLATLFKASVPLTVSLNTLANQSENPMLKRTLLDVGAAIDGGMPFSKALQEYPDVFSNFFIQMVKAGEESGNLDEVLNYLAEHQDREYYIESKVRGAMIYPAFILGVLLIVGILVLAFIVPKLLAFLTASGTENLPLLTRVIIFLSDTVRTKWYLLILGFGGTGVGIWQFLKTTAGKEIWGRVQLKLPIFGSLFQKIYLFRFSESFSMLIKGGVPINKALTITAEVISNTTYREIVLEAQKKVSQGDSIASALEGYPEVSGMVTQMIAVGEKTGQLDAILQEISAFYEDEVKNLVDNLVSLIEPILIVVMGVGVGLLVAGVLVPIYNSISSL